MPSIEVGQNLPDKALGVWQMSSGGIGCKQTLRLLACLVLLSHQHKAHWHGYTPDASEPMLWRIPAHPITGKDDSLRTRPICALDGSELRYTWWQCNMQTRRLVQDPSHSHRETEESLQPATC